MNGGITVPQGPFEEAKARKKPQGEGLRTRKAGQFETLVSVLEAIRVGDARTRAEVGRQTGLGRAIVAERVEELIELGLVSEGEPEVSTGGRPGRTLGFGRSRGHILAVDLGATALRVGIADLDANLVLQAREPADVAALGPEAVLTRVGEIYQKLKSGTESLGGLWGVGVGVPGPVDFAAGRMPAPSTMPAWDLFPIREWMTGRYGVHVHVDNDANVLAVGEARAGKARGHRDVLFVKVGTHIGAGVIAGGVVQRGVRGFAGDIGHVHVAEQSPVVCSCGRIGCLSAVAGSAALRALAAAAAADGRSPFLAQVLETRQSLDLADLASAVSHGDSTVLEIITTAGETIGEALAVVVNLLNPSMIVLGGGLTAAAGDALLAAIRRSIYGGSLPLATSELAVVSTALPGAGGCVGLATLTIQDLFSPDKLERWLPSGMPDGSVVLENTPSA